MAAIRKRGYQNRTEEVVTASAFPTKESQGNKPDLIGYNVQSTASATFDGEPPARLPISQHRLLRQIADHLADGDEPHVIIQIHGFNNPPKVALERYRQGFETLIGQNHPSGMVYIGYDWPSESAGQPGFKWGMTPAFLPWCVLLLTLISMIVFGIGKATGLFLHRLIPDTWSPLVVPILGFALLTIIIAIRAKEPLGKAVKAAIFGIVIPIALPIVAFVLLIAIPILLALRFIVYYRDQYRATHYGVVDMVTFLRELDHLMHRRFGDVTHRKRVKLSFIGHSMGAFVTTNLVRILSDVFDPNSLPSKKRKNEEELREVGRTLRLENLVLVSPDIPTETVLTGRANFVASALRRFKSRFLFSNEGDEVVNLIAGAAHSFSLPTNSKDFNVRLANLCLFREGQAYGAQAADVPWSAGVWTARETLELLDPGMAPFAECFTIVDCTDAKDNLTIWRTIRDAKPGRSPFKRVLSPNIWPIGRKAGGHLNGLGHFVCLLNYIWRYDLHSAYFDAEFIRHSLFGVAAKGDDWQLPDDKLKYHQIALLKHSPSGPSHGAISEVDLGTLVYENVAVTLAEEVDKLPPYETARLGRGVPTRLAFEIRPTGSADVHKLRTDILNCCANYHFEVLEYHFEHRTADGWIDIAITQESKDFALAVAGQLAYIAIHMGHTAIIKMSVDVAGLVKFDTEITPENCEATFATTSLRGTLDLGVVPFENLGSRLAEEIEKLSVSDKDRLSTGPRIQVAILFHQLVPADHDRIEAQIIKGSEGNSLLILQSHIGFGPTLATMSLSPDPAKTTLVSSLTGFIDFLARQLGTNSDISLTANVGGIVKFGVEIKVGVAGTNPPQ